MSDAKRIRVEAISSKDASRIVRSCHYSGASCQNSQLHLGVFLDGKCGGVMQYGPSIDKRRMLGLVRGTTWNGFLELNRLAFADWLPKNSESRALSVSFRIIRRNYPHVKWIVSFADATQCGDGTIYRASGFILTQIKTNSTLLRMPDGSIVADKTLNDHPTKKSGWWKKRGAKPLPGFQLRYIRFLDPLWVDRLAVPAIPFEKIRDIGATMYRGQRVRSETSDTPGDQPGEGGAAPTRTLHR